MSPMENILEQWVSALEKGVLPKNSSVEQLEQLASEYPWSGLIAVLRLLGDALEKGSTEKDLLFNAALSVQDRKQLRQLIALLPREQALIPEPADADSDPTSVLRQNRDRILEEFLQKEPRIVPDKDSEYHEAAELASESLRDDPDLVSETLARIYALQGNLTKARHIYEKLRLKYPEKSAYFAALISGLDSRGSHPSEN